MRLIPSLALLALLAACGTEPNPPPPPLAGKIVFASTRQSPTSGRSQLYSMNPDGSDVQQIPISLPPSLGQPDVAPSGDRLAFVRDGIYVVNAAGTGLQHPIPGPVARPHWSPDGKRLAYIAPDSGGKSDIWVANADGSNPVNLTLTDTLSDGLGNWSSDGTHLVFGRSPGDLSVPDEIWIMNADGTMPHRVASDSAYLARSPVFSPDGALIAYTGDGYQLRIVRPDGTGDRLIFDGGTATVNDPAWSPDGSLLAFGYGLAIATIRVDGTDLQIIADSAFNLQPVWGPAVRP